MKFLPLILVSLSAFGAGESALYKGLLQSDLNGNQKSITNLLSIVAGQHIGDGTGLSNVGHYVKQGVSIGMVTNGKVVTISANSGVSGIRSYGRLIGSTNGSSINLTSPPVTLTEITNATGWPLGHFVKEGLNITLTTNGNEVTITGEAGAGGGVQGILSTGRLTGTTNGDVVTINSPALTQHEVTNALAELDATYRADTTAYVAPGQNITITTNGSLFTVNMPSLSLSYITESEAAPYMIPNWNGAAWVPNFIGTNNMAPEVDALYRQVGHYLKQGINVSLVTNGNEITISGQAGEGGGVQGILATGRLTGTTNGSVVTVNSPSLTQNEVTNALGDLDATYRATAAVIPGYNITVTTNGNLFQVNMPSLPLSALTDSEIAPHMVPVFTGIDFHANLIATNSMAPEADALYRQVGHYVKQGINISIETNGNEVTISGEAGEGGGIQGILATGMLTGTTNGSVVTIDSPIFTVEAGQNVTITTNGHRHTVSMPSLPLSYITESEAAQNTVVAYNGLAFSTVFISTNNVAPETDALYRADVGYYVEAGINTLIETNGNVVTIHSGSGIQGILTTGRATGTTNESVVTINVPPTIELENVTGGEMSGYPYWDGAIWNVGALSIGLEDIHQGTAVSYNVPMWNGVNWIPTLITSNSVDSATDTAYREGIKSATGAGIAQVSVNGSGAASIFVPTPTLSQLDQSEATTGNVPQWNGAAWVPHQITTDDLGAGTNADNGFIFYSSDDNEFQYKFPSPSDIKSGDATEGQVMTFNGTIWAPSPPSGGGQYVTPGSNISMDTNGSVVTISATIGGGSYDIQVDRIVAHEANVNTNVLEIAVNPGETVTVELYATLKAAGRWAFKNYRETWFRDSAGDMFQGDVPMPVLSEGEVEGVNSGNFEFTHTASDNKIILTSLSPVTQNARVTIKGIVVRNTGP